MLIKDKKMWIKRSKMSICQFKSEELFYSEKVNQIQCFFISFNGIQTFLWISEPLESILLRRFGLGQQIQIVIRSEGYLNPIPNKF